MREIHTLIIWDKAQSQKEIIERIINSRLKIISKINFVWEEENFLKNLIIFYAHSQKDKSLEEYTKIIENKIHHCGKGLFTLFILEDANPQYENRETSSGYRFVNINLFDLKIELRQITAGGHKIHASDNTFESNKDLTILLGKNTEDFLSQNNYFYRENYTKNCLGADGFNSIEELFYLLNNSIDYVVLRNFECLPKQYTVEGHGDIDFLVENFNYIRYLTSALPVYPDLKYRVHYTILINNENVPVDFRYIGDDYYDIKWQSSILKNYKIYNNIVKVPNDTNLFYSLLYHAYVQKLEIKEDYYPKLEFVAKQININYHRNMSLEEVKSILDDYIKENNYTYTVCHDPTVIFNTNFINNQDILEQGDLISSTNCRYENQVFSSQVFLDISRNIITKICSPEIGQNENRYLSKLNKSGITPQIFSYEDDHNYSKIVMEYIEGRSLLEIKKIKSFWNIKTIKHFLDDSVNILETLQKYKIQHRDIRPNNFIIDNNNRLFLIDFGWAKDINDNLAITPYGLGSFFRYEGLGFSDIYSMGKVLDVIFDEFPTIKKFVKKSFLSVTPDTESNIDLNVIRENISEMINNLTLKEKTLIYLYRNPKILKKLKKIYYKVRYNYDYRT